MTFISCNALSLFLHATLLSVGDENFLRVEFNCNLELNSWIKSFFQALRAENVILNFFKIFLTKQSTSFWNWFLIELKLRRGVLVQGVKDRIGLKSSDVDQGMKICIHGQFHILNWFRRVAVLRNQQEAVKCTKYTAKYAKTGIIPSVNSFNYFFTYENGA